jgi:hypothetical protein
VSEYAFVLLLITQPTLSLTLSLTHTYTHTQAISVDSSGGTQGVVCIGGLNRQDSQELRYGGSMCFEDQDIHDQLNDAVDSADSC